MPHARLPHDGHVYLAMTTNAWRHAHRRRVSLTPARPVSQNRHRLTLAAERQAHRSRRHITAGPSRSDQLVRTAELPLNTGASLIVILLLSLGLWAARYGALSSDFEDIIGLPTTKARGQQQLHRSAHKKIRVATRPR